MDFERLWREVVVGSGQNPDDPGVSAFVALDRASRLEAAQALMDLLGEASNQIFDGEESRDSGDQLDRIKQAFGSFFSDLAGAIANAKKRITEEAHPNPR